MATIKGIQKCPLLDRWLPYTVSSRQFPMNQATVGGDIAGARIVPYWSAD